MKTHLPTAITTVQEAKAFLKALWTNGESFHPDDDASQIHDLFMHDEALQVNTLMDAIHALDFDPSEYLLELDFRLSYGIDEYEKVSGYKVSVSLIEPEGEACAGYGPNMRYYLTIDRGDGKCLYLAFTEHEVFTLILPSGIYESNTLDQMSILEAFIEVYGEDKRPDEREHPITGIEPHSVEHLYDMDKDELDQEIVYKACDVRKLANDIDTAFEVIRVSWDNPTPQANQTINEAWAQVRRVLGQVTKEGKLK